MDKSKAEKRAASGYGSDEPQSAKELPLEPMPWPTSYGEEESKQSKPLGDASVLGSDPTPEAS